VPFAIDCSGRRALVTGGGNGLGTEICRGLVDAGAFVFVNDIYEDRAKKVVEELGGSSVAEAVKADVTSPLKITRMRAETGPVDILVNNAGIPTSGFELKKFVDTNPEDWEPMMRLNLGAILHVTHAYVGAMVEAGWGRVVTIVSDAGRKGERYQAIYGSAKAGAMGFMRGLAAEVGAHGVTANCVALGTMRSGFSEEAIVANPELEARMSKPYTIPRLGLPADVAPLVALLCSDAGAWITGQVYPVDGGYVSSL
jgi:3-oxoacyl-[acyl-carrier protein] reductase